jgi:DNA-binding SARP family transcriptional activator
VQFRILGPLEVGDGDGERALPNRRKSRTLLATLLLSPDRVVARDALVDLLWGDAPPPSATANLHSYAADLRRTVSDGAAPRLVAERGGYRLRVGPGELDAAEFARLAGLGSEALRRDEHATAVDQLGRALGRWRGRVLEGLELPEPLQPALVRLETVRLDAVEDWLEARLLAEGAPSAAALAAELEGLVREHPLRERMWALLMRALTVAGRRAGALATYRRLEEVLKRELGVPPGPQVRRLYERIRARDAPATAGSPRPRQLPADLVTFAGRAGYLGVLDRLVGGPARVAVLAGPAGVGKTTLALHWAHRSAARFPDGQLYADLRGFVAEAAPTPGPQVLRGFLAALGTPADELPRDADELLALYRSLLAGRRMLIVLDNAADAAQVRPLLPGEAGCAVLVTSRSRLAGLLTKDGAYALDLDLPSAAEAHELLARRIGTARLQAAPAAAAAILERCGRLPLALAIIATRAALRPGLPLESVVAELAADRLDALADGDGTDVRGVISWSYRLLSPTAARLLRLLALHPGPDIAVPAATSLLGAPAGNAVRELRAVCLLTEPHPGRFAMHDLLREYAGELSVGPADRRAALERMFDHYLHSMHAALLAINPTRAPMTLDRPTGGVRVEVPADEAAALEWQEAEDAVLDACPGLAFREGFDLHALEFGRIQSWSLERQGRYRDWLPLASITLAAAERHGDPVVLGDVHRRLAGALATAGDLDGADVALRRALELFEGAGEIGESGQALLNLSLVAELRERYAEAVGHARDAFALFTAAADELRAANALGAIGWYLSLAGRDAEAAACCRRAIAEHQRLGNRLNEGLAWDTLGVIQRRRGEYADAVDSGRRAVEACRETGQVLKTARVLEHLGDAYEKAADLVAARATWVEAERIMARIGEPGLDRVRGKLAG